MDWLNAKTSMAGIQIPNWLIVLGAAVIVILLITSRHSHGHRFHCGPAATSDLEPRQIDGAPAGQDALRRRDHKSNVDQPGDGRFGKAVCEQKRLRAAIGRTGQELQDTAPIRNDLSFHHGDEIQFLESENRVVAIGYHG
jgi:hypothetical protein